VHQPPQIPAPAEARQDQNLLNILYFLNKSLKARSSSILGLKPPIGHPIVVPMQHVDPCIVSGCGAISFSSVGQVNRLIKCFLSLIDQDGYLRLSNVIKSTANSGKPLSEEVSTGEQIPFPSNQGLNVCWFDD